MKSTIVEIAERYPIERVPEIGDRRENLGPERETLRAAQRRL